MASYLIKLDGQALVDPMVREICMLGQTPVVSLERTLERYLLTVVQDALGNIILKPPVVRLPRYFKERYATLPALARSGYTTWYVQIAFATKLAESIDEVEFVTLGIKLNTLDYDIGGQLTTQLKSKRMKTQLRYELRIDTLSVDGSVFSEVRGRVQAAGALEQRLIANFSCGPDIVGHRVVSFDDMLTGERYFCDCAREMHAKLLKNVREIRNRYVKGSWPHQLATLLDDPQYLKGICHLCIARTSSPSEARSRYGASIEDEFLQYVDQIAFDENMDRVTARAEVQQLVGLSRWIREARLYRWIKDLFPDCRVLREASPEWLGRLRFDIYLPDLKLAIEHHGEQHYRALDVFGGQQAHLETLKRDQLKRDLCAASGIDLVEIRYDAPITKIALRQRLSKFIHRAKALNS